MLLFVLGAIIQAGGVVYTFVGFEDAHLSLVIAALIFGGLVELGGIVLILQKR